MFGHDYYHIFDQTMTTSGIQFPKNSQALSKDIASYQRDVYKITQPPIAFFLISHTFLSLDESKGKWKSRKAQLVSHGMRGNF